MAITWLIAARIVFCGALLGFQDAPGKSARESAISAIASAFFSLSICPPSVVGSLVSIGRAVGGGFRSWERHMNKEVRPPAARSDLSVPAATGAVPDGAPDVGTTAN